MKIKVGVVTVSRSDYGIYRPLLDKFYHSKDFELQLFVTGMHLSSAYREMLQEIEQDGYPIQAKIDMLLSSDSPVGIAKSMGLGTLGFADALNKSRPDVLIVLGDRFEMHAAALASVPFKIPLIHIHGGELTYGAFDELFRHSLTKMSHLHFVSMKDYKWRVIQMGEDPSRVIVSGALALDYIDHQPLLTRSELEKTFGIDMSRPVVLVTFHPVTMEYEHTGTYAKHLLNALEDFSNCTLVFTGSNVDTHSSVITAQIKLFIARKKNAYFVKHFGQHGYFSMLKLASVMVGNSSSGIIEAPSFKLPVVNIGTRQKGRVRSKNVIDVGAEPDSIRVGLMKGLSPEFRLRLEGLINPYGDGRASERILSTLRSIDVQSLTPKLFYDLPFLEGRE